MAFKKSINFPEDREFVRTDYRDQTIFRDYLAQVQDLFAKSSQPLSHGDILRALGYENQAMLGDALECLALTEVGVCPTRYVRSEIAIKGIPKDQLMARLFPNRKRF